jgi:hypothetical protein
MVQPRFGLAAAVIDRERIGVDQRLPARAYRLRRPRFRAVSAPLVRAIDGLFARHAGQAGGRHRRHRLGLQQLPPPFSRADRGGEARRAGRRRAAAGEFPTISLGEVFLSPTSLKYRNLMAIDTEEMIRAADGRGRADRRLRQDRAGAADGRGSADRPAIQLVAGPMMTGAIAASGSAPAPIAALLGAIRAGDVDGGAKSARSRAGSRPPPAPAR